MKNLKRIFLASMIITALGLTILLPALAKPVYAAEAIYTATPESNGNIYYIVKANDTCESIALVNSITIDQLRSLNQLNVGDCDNLTVGRKLLIAVVPTAVITVGPSPTPTSSIPTPIPPKGTGKVCIYLYNDINGNAIAETGESSIAGGQISIANADGSYSNTAATTGDDVATCFSDIPEGQYTISVAIPQGYNATSDQNYTITLKSGDTSTVNFSAQQGSGGGGGTSTPGGSILLAVLGGLILIVGVGVGVYAYLTSQRR
jgi:LysM repeat protein